MQLVRQCVSRDPIGFTRFNGLGDCLCVDEELRRVGNERARQSWCGSRAARQAYGDERCGHVVARAAAVACVRSVLR